MGLVTVSGPSAAVPVRELYVASVPIADQGPRAREAGVRDALEAVLVRVSGQRGFATGRGSPLLDRPNSFLQGFGYETSPGGLRLKARFDPRAIDGALRELGLPVWGINRLSHQVWIAIRDDGQPRALLDAAGAAARAPSLLAAAELRGIPLEFPAMDATDRKLAGFNSVWNGDFGGVRGAARRHNPDVVVVVRAERNADAWLTRMTVLKDDGQEEHWSRLHQTLEQSLAEAFHELADRQAQRFAVQTGSQQDMLVEVDGIAAIGDYARVLDYLRRLNPVRAVFVEEVGGDRVRYRLVVEGDPQLLPRVIASGSLLQPQPGTVPAALRYSLAR